MKNTLVFEQFDMVVSMTQKTINDQLTHLLKLGVIRSTFVLYQAINDQDDFEYHVVDSWEKVPKDAKGNPEWACLNGKIHPQVVITQSGTNIVLLLKFRSGSAYFWTGKGPTARLKKYDMTGWQYGISVSLDLAGIAKEDIGKKIAVPEIVDKQLNHFVDSMFTVNSLFMDFESTDLMRFDPTRTSTQGAGDLIMEQFTEFMTFYLKDLVRTGNPYILGYSITANDQTRIPDSQNVPAALKPMGTTFTMFKDAQNQDLSNLNFVLATKGGQGKITGTPGVFDTNWISPDEQCNAKMIYSHGVLVEHFFLKPLFDQMSTKIYDQIKNNITVSKGNAYADAKKGLADGTGFKFTISDVASGNDQYVNNYTVKFQNGTSRVDLLFSGQIALHKEVDKNMGFCTATAYASGSVDWSGTISIIADVDEHNAPRLKTTQSFKVDKTSSNQHKNDCAEAFDWIGKILGTIVGLFTPFGLGGLLGNLFADLLAIETPGIGDVGVVFGNLSNAIGATIMLPAGEVFLFKNPSADGEGNFAMQLTYQSENQ